MFSQPAPAIIAQKKTKNNKFVFSNIYRKQQNCKENYFNKNISIANKK